MVGAAHDVLTTVLITAMHGDKFRWVLARVLAQAGPSWPGSCSLKDIQATHSPCCTIWTIHHAYPPNRLPTPVPPCPARRPVVLSTLRALPDGRTAYNIRSTVIFLIKPNGFIKAMIDKGEPLVAGWLGDGWLGGFRSSQTDLSKP